MSQEKIKRGKGRPRGFDQESALEAAMITFWSRGFRTTSLDDLVDATGASRASLYQVFGDKRALFGKCLNLYGDRFTQRVQEVMDTNENGRDALYQILKASADRLVSSEAPAGCLRCNSTLELMGSEEGLDKVLNEANDKYMDNIRKVMDRSVIAGELSKERAERLVLFVTAAVNGMVTLSRSGASRDELERIIILVLELFHE